MVKKSELSYFRQRIMGDDKVKYIYSTKSKVIHDKSCVSARNIPDEYLVYLEEYSPEMSQCSHCAVKAYVRLGAKDFHNFKTYEKLFQKMHLKEELLRHMYVDCRMQTKASDDFLMIWDREDKWKIVSLDNRGTVQLLHNNYHLLHNGERKFVRGFHIQGEYTDHVMVSTAIRAIETYSFDKHRASSEVKRQRKETESKSRQAVQSVMALAVDETVKKYVPGSLWKKIKGWFQGRKRADGQPIGKEPFSVQIHNFNMVEKAGYPSDGEWCIYIWKAKTGEYRWQNGVYDADKGCFVISYKEVSCITGKRKVIAWKKLDNTAFTVRKEVCKEFHKA